MLRNLPVRMPVTLALVINLAAGPATLSAQQAPAEIPDITIRTNTRLVVVDVVVTHKNGEPVTGLKAENFTIEENGKKQKVSLFVAPGTGAASRPAPAPTPAGILSNHPENVGPSGVPTVLLLDAANSQFRDQVYARSQMLKYAVEQGQSGHPMAVLTLTDRLQVLQQFTSDPQVLMKAIKNLRPQEPILQGAPAPLESHGIATGVDRGGGGGFGSSTALATAQGAVQQFADIQVGYNLERRTVITIEAMKALTRILGGLPGRKNVVWLTASLPFDLVPEDRNISDAELLADLPGQGRQRSVSVNSAGAYAAEARQLHGQEIKEAESQLANTNIAIYPVDVTGLMSGMENSASRPGSVYSDTAISGRALGGVSVQQAAQDTMREIALQTGGKAYVNQNEIKDGITLAVSDEKASYSIGYYPENKKWDGKFRSLKVKVDQGDTQVRYRKGYYALDPAQDKKANFEQEVAAALETGAPATQVSFMAQAMPTDPGKMRVLFKLDAHTLTAEDAGGGKKMNVILYASVYSADGKNVGTRSVKVDRTFDAATYQKLLDKGMLVPIDMDKPAGGQNLRLAVLDNKTGFIGTASGTVGQ
jgi:VWFA-related protein